jgi:hypothetical protein
LDIAHRSLAGAAVDLGIERDFLTLVEAANAGAFQSGRVDEHVLAAVIRLNKAETLLVVIELNSALHHFACSLSLTLMHLSPKRVMRSKLGWSMFGESLNVRPARREGETAWSSGQMSIGVNRAQIWLLQGKSADCDKQLELRADPFGPKVLPMSPE